MISAPEEDCGWLKNSSYAQGWVNADYLGTNVIFHSGGLTGFLTQVGFLPGKDCGYAMSFNTGSMPGHRVARAIVLDTLIRGRPEDSYDDMIDAWLRERDEMRAKLAKNAAGTPSAIPLMKPLTSSPEKTACCALNTAISPPALWKRPTAASPAIPACWTG